ncbi:DUF1837 domain-containing protein [Pseudomonas citronellolis]|uniref:HamA C-terminal domain-containing protein n=1 Tax=Pseudomonas citronellolis TaxID=53408 RepID=UPI0018D95C7D|nr:DUF1837 domain-containing protein [Pseudomonas citronellolis]MBH3434869.1 DUF1837 domain-containing protein [Pseudomonas citronellolis]
MQSINNLKDYVENQIFKIDTNNLNTEDIQKLHLDYDSTGYRQKDLAKLLVDAVEYFALTPEEFESFTKSGNIIEGRRRAWSRISDARKDKKGDFGELLLFLALYFFYPSKSPERFVTKVRLRSSAREQIKGFDCAHFTIENNEACLWLGEAKFHKNLSGAITDAFKSISEHVKPEYLKSELKILGSNIEANNGISAPHLQKLKSLFKGKSIDKIKIKIPILITYDSATVKNNTSVCEDFINELKSGLNTKLKNIKAKEPKLPSNISLCFILFPFKSVAEVKDYLEKVEDLLK